MRTGDRPVQVGSHYHFFEVNKALVFDRKQAYGKLLALQGKLRWKGDLGDMRTSKHAPKT